MSHNCQIYTCHNCDWTGLEEDTAPIDDIWLRVEPGEFHPAGQCPECRALISCSDRDVVDMCNEKSFIRALQSLGYTVEKAETTPTSAEALRAMLRAIRARIHGVWDDPDLMAWGGLHTNEHEDILPRINALLRAEGDRS